MKTAVGLLAAGIIVCAHAWGQAVAQSNAVFMAGPEWQAINMSDLAVKAGSALDQSSLAEIQKGSSGLLGMLGLRKSGRLPRLIIGPTGKLVAENRPDRPIRLKGTGINYPWIIGAAKKDPNWKETFTRQVIAAKRQGYNMLRTSADVGTVGESFRPENLDKTDCLASEAEAHGLYRLFDCSVYLRHAWEPGEDRRDYTLRMYLGDKTVRDSWAHGVAFMMSHVNPYTGLAWKDDPGIACVILYNEQEWGFFHPKSRLDRETQAEFDAQFRRWLERKYKNPGALAKAWANASMTSFDQAVTPEKFPFDGKKISDNDYILFCGGLSHESAKWMRDTLRATGYKGLVAQYNISQWLQGQEARWGESPVTINNTYHNHPTAFDQPGSRCGQNSSIGSGAWYWRGVASARFADRPFIETEFNHSFWNPYQYECGPLFGAYSAFQGFDALSIHEGAVFTSVAKPGLGVFNVGHSPIARAGEFLSACLFLRGDVTPSSHRVELQIPKAYLQTDVNGSRSVSYEQGKLAFMVGFSVSFPETKQAEGVGEPSAPDLVLPPAGGAEFRSAGGGWAVESVDSKASDFSLAAAVASMKAKGLLDKDNQSDPSNGIFQSDTGQIVMRTKENLLKITTLRSEAVVLEGGRSERAGLLNVLGTSAPALVAACAVDQKSLARSRRIVLIYSTYAVNSGMALSADRTTLVKLGGPPVLMRTGKLEVSLRNVHAATMKLYALGIDGIRREALPLQAEDNAVRISLDTGKLKKGPTPFFELVTSN